MNINYDLSKEVLEFSFPKKIDANVANKVATEIENKLDELIGIEKSSKSLKVIFDLSNTDYASSLFLRVVVMTANRVDKGNMEIKEANQFIRDLFKTSGIGQFIKISKSAAEKIKVYYPPAEFSAKTEIGSIAKYRRLYKKSIDDPDSFWKEMAKNELIWEKDFDKVSEWKDYYAKWFIGGKLNACYNCLDKHLHTTPDKIAILWEGEPDSAESPAEVRKVTYKELHENVCKFANVLKQNGIKKGDRVIIYMPMLPETVVAMLACARLGAIHSVIFAGFSAQAVAERTEDCQAKIILTADGFYRRGSVLDLKKTIDDAMEIKKENGEQQTATVEKVIIYKHASNKVSLKAGRDLWWHSEMEKVEKECAPEYVDSEDELFILYTSGSTGKPKGIVHSTAGYLLGAKLSHKHVLDSKDSDIYWCTADVGWITGHSYIVYGPLANGSTIFMYEGTPNYPDPGRFWKLIEKHKINVLYTAPTAIRSFMKWGDQWPSKHDLSSLRLLGTVGEPINPQAWRWYNEIIGGKKCPIIDTWWQTETGGIMISPLPGAIPTKAGSATLPFFGIVPEVVDEQGNKVPPDTSGTLVIRKPWPSMLRGLWNDADRYIQTYWVDNPGSYTTGDSARQDEDGYFWIVGREDDVINVSGHRIGTAEVENVLVSHDSVVEAAAVARADDIKGSALVVFVTLMDGVQHSSELTEDIRQFVGKQLGAVIKPDEVRLVEALPKTRSGKIMRRLLKQIAAGTEITGDVTTLEDINILAQLSNDK